MSSGARRRRDDAVQEGRERGWIAERLVGVPHGASRFGVVAKGRATAFVQGERRRAREHGAEFAGVISDVADDLHLGPVGHEIARVHARVALDVRADAPGDVDELGGGEVVQAADDDQTVALVEGGGEVRATLLEGPRAERVAGDLAERVERARARRRNTPIGDGGARAKSRDAGDGGTTRPRLQRRRSRHRASR